MKDKILVYLLIFTIFSKELASINIFGFEIDIFSYSFHIIFFFYFIFSKQFFFTRKELTIFTVIFLQGILAYTFFNVQFLDFSNQFFPILIFYIVTKCILKNKNLFDVMQAYVDISYLVAAIGILQFILKLFFNTLILTEYHGLFIDSVALEPSHYLAIVLPAVLYLYESKRYNFKFYVLLISVILTFKLTLLLALFLYILYRFDFKKSILLFSLFFIFFTDQFFSLDRINSVVAYTNNFELHEIDNLTTFSYFSNLKVASLNFVNTFGFGVGLGGHFNSYFMNLADYNDMFGFGLNAKSAHSLFIRLFSEFPFLLFYFIFSLLKINISKNPDHFKIIFVSCLSHFFVKTIKLGGYFDYGTLFFFVVMLISLTNSNALDSKKV